MMFWTLCCEWINYPVEFEGIQHFGECMTDKEPGWRLSSSANLPHSTAEECRVDALEAIIQTFFSFQKPSKTQPTQLRLNRFSLDAWFIGILRCERVDETFNCSQIKLVTSRHAEVLTQSGHQQLFYGSFRLFLFLPISFLPVEYNMMNALLPRINDTLVRIRERKLLQINSRSETVHCSKLWSTLIHITMHHENNGCICVGQRTHFDRRTRELWKVPSFNVADWNGRVEPRHEVDRE